MAPACNELQYIFLFRMIVTKFFDPLPHPANCFPLHHLESRLKIGGEILFPKSVEMQFSDTSDTSSHHLDQAFDPRIAPKGATTPITSGN